MGEIVYNKDAFDQTVSEFKTKTKQVGEFKLGLDKRFANIKAAWEDPSKTAERDAEFQKISVNMEKIFENLEDITKFLDEKNTAFYNVKY